jgi:hypothetical protein
MIIGICTLQLRLPASHSLKDKRQVLRSLTARVRHDFNVSIAEVDELAAWQSATLGIACVSSDRDYAHGLLTKVADAIASYRLDAEVYDYRIELV